MNDTDVDISFLMSLLTHLPQNARLVEFYLAAAGLDRFLGHQDWKDHLR